MRTPRAMNRLLVLEYDRATRFKIVSKAPALRRRAVAREIPNDNQISGILKWSPFRRLRNAKDDVSPPGSSRYRP